MQNHQDSLEREEKRRAPVEGDEDEQSQDRLNAVPETQKLMVMADEFAQAGKTGGEEEIAGRGRGVREWDW